MICSGAFINLNNFKDILTLNQNQNTTIRIGKEQSNPSSKYFFKTFNFKCVNGYQQKVFSETFSEISSLTLSNTSIPASNYAISQNKSLFSFFNFTHYYENYSFLDFNSKLQPTFASLCISDITLDKILRKQVQLANSWGLEDVLNCLFSVAISMKRLHDSLIIHGNLCPSNILVDKAKQCYVSDFSLYKIKELYYKPPFFNSQYSAPELDHFHPTKSTDIFSYGVIVCRLLQDIFFPAQSNVKLVQFVLEGRIDILTVLPQPLTSIITQCLDKNPEKRCNFKFIIENFQNSTFKINRFNISPLFTKFQQTNYIVKLASVDDPIALNSLGDLFSDPSKALKVVDDKEKEATNNDGNYFIQTNDSNFSNMNKNVARSSSGNLVVYDGHINEQKAAECYERSASFGNSEAQASYGICLINGRGIAKDVLTGITNIEKSSKQGCVKGHFYLGMCHFKGIGVSKIDLRKAEQYLQLASQSMDDNQNESIICQAKFNLGLIMENSKQLIEAAKYFKIAAYLALESRTNFSSTSFVCPEALYHYGRYLEKGIGTQSDLAAAQRFYKMAHFQGYDQGSFEYAKFILEDKLNSESNDTDKNKFLKEEAIIIMKSLASKENKRAKKYLESLKQTHDLNDKAKPVSKEERNKNEKNKDDKSKDRKSHNDNEKSSDSNKSSSKKAKSETKILEKFEKLRNDLFEKNSQHLFNNEKEFIESKNPDIIYNFAELYQQGNYVKKDDEKADNYYKISAELGNSNAQYKYGLILINRGTAPNFKKDKFTGLKMLQKSASQENTNGMEAFLRALRSEEYNHQTFIRGINFLKDMADKGSNLARLYYGQYLLNGLENNSHSEKEGSYQNPEEGLRYIKMAADGNLLIAKFYYAIKMLKGQGMPKDEKKAMRIIEDLAINEKHVKSIKKCLRYYKDVDHEKELKFMKLYADTGNEDFMFKYGLELINTKASSNENYAKEGEEYLIKSGKAIPSNIHLKYFVKNESGKYVEVQHKKRHNEQEKIKQQMKKLEEKAFSDSDDQKSSNRRLLKRSKDDYDDQESELEDDEEVAQTEKYKPNSSNTVNEPSRVKHEGKKKYPFNIPLDSDEKQKLDRRIMIQYLNQRLKNGESPKDINEIKYFSEVYNGNTKAMRYFYNVFKENDDTKKSAANLILFASNRMDVDAMFILSKIYFEGNGFRKSPKKSFDILVKISNEFDDPRAQYEAGIMLYEGTGVQVSKYQAFQYFEKAANKNDIPSMIMLSKIYKKGISRSTQKDLNKMAYYLQKIADMTNDPATNYKLGSYYLESEKDPEKAFKYLKEAASKKNVKASFKLYKMFNENYYGEKYLTKKKADKYLISACKRNYQPALDAYKERYGKSYQSNDSSLSESEDEDVDVKKRNDAQNGIINFEDDKEFFLQCFNVNITNCPPHEIVVLGRNRLENATKAYHQKKDQTHQNSNSDLLEKITKEFNDEKRIALKCFDYAMNKGDPEGYFEYAKLLDNPEEALQYMQYAKEHNVAGADIALFNVIEQIGKKAESDFNSKNQSGYANVKVFNRKITEVSENFLREKAYVYAAKWFKKANDSWNYDKCVQLAMNNIEALDANQQFLLGKMVESSSKLISKNKSESDETNPKKIALEIYKTAFQNGNQEAEENYKRLSKALLNEMSSSADDSQKLNELGLSFLEGRNGAPIDYQKASSYFEKAAAVGNIDAIVNYGKCLLFGQGVDQDDAKAFSYFSKAANQFQKRVEKIEDSSDSYSLSSSESSTTSSDESDFDLKATNDQVVQEYNPVLEGMCYYAFCLLKGRGTPNNKKNVSKANDVFYQAAKQGSVEAMLQYGLGHIDEPDGPHFLKKAADANNPEAQYMFSKYLNDKDMDLSLHYLKLAAENQNYKPFFVNLADDDDKNSIKKSAGYYEPAVEAWGKKLYENIDDETDPAVDYFRKLANDMNVYGLYMYAQCISQGFIDDSEVETNVIDKNNSNSITKVNESKYRWCLRKAADLGDSESQYLYAKDKADDEDEQNYSEEVSRYFKLAADKGHVGAAIEYAQRLEGGKGVKKNLNEAIKYCQKVISIEPDNGPAKILIERIKKKIAQS